MGMLSIVFADGIENVNTVATIRGFEGLFANILGVVIELAAIIFFLMLVSGGFRYITSGGNPKLVEAAKGTITYAIFGLILTLSAYFILELIQIFTGAQILRFRVAI